jgi:hypothetical protein
MRLNQVTVIQIDDSSDLNRWLESNPGWIPFHIERRKINDVLLEKIYDAWLRYGGK